MNRSTLVGLRALVVLAGVLPWVLVALGSRTPALVLAFHGLCHQRPERTLALFGAPMLVCSRCAGVYAGVALGALLALPPRWLGHGRTLVVLAAAFAVLDVATQDLGLHAPWHPVRLATGLLLGWTASAFMFGSLAAEQPGPRGLRALHKV